MPKAKTTAKAYLAKALLDGEIITCANCLDICGLHAPSREIIRQIEEPFGVRISRVTISSKNRYGQPISYMQYRLNRDAPENKEGINKMREYISEHFVSSQPSLLFS